MTVMATTAGSPPEDSTNYENRADRNGVGNTGNLEKKLDIALLVGNSKADGTGINFPPLVILSPMVFRQCHSLRQNGSTTLATL